MNLNPKKIIGSLGRRYGGKTFRLLRKAYYDSIYFCKEIAEIVVLSSGKYPKKSEWYLFRKKYYKDIESKNERNVASGIICMFDGRILHGGLTDRIRGILTAYDKFKDTDIPFYIYWATPFQLDKYLEPASFDWRIKQNLLDYSNKHSFPLFIINKPDFYSNLRMKFGVKKRFKQIHLYSNADNGKGRYKDLYKKLFTPSLLLKKEVDKHLKNIGGPYVAFAFRFLRLLGDFKDFTNDVLEEKDALELMEKVYSELKKLLKEVPQNYKVFITGDSQRFIEYVLQREPSLYSVKGESRHIDDVSGEFFDEQWLKTFVDQYLLMNAEKVTLLKTGKMYKSGFSRFAAEVGGAEFIYHEF